MQPREFLQAFIAKDEVKFKSVRKASASSELTLDEKKELWGFVKNLPSNEILSKIMP